jgi:hypothetical protein
MQPPFLNTMKNEFRTHRMFLARVPPNLQNRSSSSRIFRLTTAASRRDVIDYVSHDKITYTQEHRVVSPIKEEGAEVTAAYIKEENGHSKRE